MTAGIQLFDTRLIALAIIRDISRLTAHHVSAQDLQKPIVTTFPMVSSLWTVIPGLPCSWDLEIPGHRKFLYEQRSRLSGV
jgi:hypothetical protein